MILTPVSVAPEILAFDIWVLAAVTLLAVPVMLLGKRISRVEGAVFILLYAAFVWVQFDPIKPTTAQQGPAPALAGTAAVVAAPMRP